MHDYVYRRATCTERLCTIIHIKTHIHMDIRGTFIFCRAIAIHIICIKGGDHNKATCLLCQDM